MENEAACEMHTGKVQESLLGEPDKGAKSHGKDFLWLRLCPYFLGLSTKYHRGEKAEIEGIIF